MIDAAPHSLPRAARRPRDLPAPPGSWPWLGHLAQVKPLQVHRQFEHWGRIVRAAGIEAE